MSATSSHRRRSRFSRRGARIAVLAVVVLAIALTIGRVLWMRGGERKEGWRQHDEALVLFEAERYEEAIAAYRAILERSPDDKIARFNLGLALVRTGESSGWDEIQAVAAADTGFDAAQLALVDRAVDLGDLSEAVQRLTLVVERPPYPPGARARLAELMLATGRRAAAMRELRRVVESGDGGPLVTASAAIRLAREHGRQADLHESPAAERRRERQAYQVAIQEIERSGVFSQPPDAWDAETIAISTLRPFALAALGRQEEALGAVALALDAPLDASRRATLRVLRAQLLWLEGDAQRAERELADALAEEQAPDPQAYRAAADLYESRGFRARAVEVLRSGVANHPSDEALRLSLARVLFLSGQADEAESVLRGDDEYPTSDAALLFLGDLRRYVGNRDGARNAYTILQERRPHRLDVRLRLASVDAQHRFEGGTSAADAAAALEDAASAALERDPDDAEALLARARARLLRLGEDAGADALRPVIDDLVRVIDADPLQFEAHILLAHVRSRIGYHQDAAVGLERVLARLPVERPFLRILLSRAYLGMGASQAALEQARRAVDGLGDDSRALLAVVDAASMAGERDAAVEALVRLTRVEPDEVSYHVTLAVIHVQAGDAAAADTWFASAEAIAESRPDEDERARELKEIASARAAAYLDRGDERGALTTLERLLERYPSRAEAHVAHGRLLLALGQAAGAERAFQTAVGLAPESLLPRRALVDLWCDRGELTAELTDVVRRMREVGGPAPMVLYAEGRLAFLQGDLQVARTKLEECAQDLADDADVQYALGIVLSQTGRLDASVTALERAVSLAPRSERARDALARARFALARELARRGRIRAARDLLAGTVRADPGAERPRRALAGLIGMTEGVEVSEQRIREMLSRNPDDVVLRQMLAAALVRSGDHAGATRELLRVAEGAPEDWTVWASLSLVRLRMEDHEGAARFADRARQAAPDDPRSLGPTLQLLTTTGRMAQAQRLLDEAVAAAPDEPQLYLLRALLHARNERYEDVVADASRALELSPSMTAAGHLAVYSLRYGMRDAARAEAFARSCADRAPDVAEYVFLIGWLAADRGDDEAALSALIPLAAREPPHQVAIDAVAMLLLRAQRTAEARENLARGLSVNPENPNFHYLHAQSLLQDAVAAGDAEVLGSERSAVIASLERTLELAPAHHTARNNLAFVLMAEEERRAEALDHALRAVDDAPRHAAYRDTLGTIQLRMDRAAEALETFRGALATIAESRMELDRQMDAAGGEPDATLRRFRRRLERQEAEIRGHFEEAQRLSGGE
jgi:tetratricopeptide (TPR) repeat protein